MTSLFFSYSHADETLRDQLAKHMAAMRRQGVIDDWHDRKMLAGDHIDGEIKRMMEQADIILLLVSPDFIASDYCYDIEMARAVQRHEAGECRTVPVILRPCDWHGTPFGTLLATPRDGRAVTLWTNIDEAFLDVAKAVKAAAVDIRARKGNSSPQRKKPNSLSSTPTAAPMLSASVPEVSAKPKSGKRRSFGVRATDAERDEFLEAAFEEMARHFQAELDALSQSHRDVRTAFRRVDADHFLATIYVEGNARCRGKVWIGRGSVMGGINFSQDQSSNDSSYNECLTLKDEGGELAFNPLGLNAFGHDRDRPMDSATAATYLWSVFTRALS
ncbi:toll/interleukin-1 receptor domain-containing protein [Indioceanicola profundi]|uniref:toll/interleukin-1 receptor domain-containing protein n=1 Tax=Indioceanicola profundi TaxID=2220096 RepID=UPI0013C520E4|nr:toll/interleukin-1 receptor domain-containing protein [Indioceanicola profundi]